MQFFVQCHIFLSKIRKKNVEIASKPTGIPAQICPQYEKIT